MKLSHLGIFTLLIGASLGLCLSSCSTEGSSAKEEKVVWNPPNEFTLIDKCSSGTLSHMKTTPNLDSSAIHQLVYVAVNTDVHITKKNVRVYLTNTLCIRNVSVDQPIIVNQVEYFDAEGDPIRKYLEHPVELRPLQSIWLIVNGNEGPTGTGTNFIVDWAAMQPVPQPIIESMMAGSYSQTGLSFKSETVVVKEWIRGKESKVCVGETGRGQ